MAKKAEPVRRKAKISDFVDEACSEFESLQEEMQNWYDSIPENLQGGDKGSAVEEAANELEEASTRPDFPEGVEDEEMEIVMPGRTEKQMMKLSRADRCGDAVSVLSQVVEHLQAMIDDLAEKKTAMEAADETTKGAEAEGFDDLTTAINEYMDEIQNLIDIAEAVTFPGMFG